MLFDYSQNWVVEFVAVAYVLLEECWRYNCFIAKFDLEDEELLDDLDLREAQLDVNWIIIARHNPFAHSFHNLNSSKFLVQFLHINTIEHDVFDRSPVIHRHVLYFGTLENVVAFRLIKDVFQMMNNIMANIRIRITVETVVSAALLLFLQRYQLDRAFVLFASAKFIMVVILNIDSVLREAEEAQLNVTPIDIVDQVQFLLAGQRRYLLGHLDVFVAV